MNKIHLIMPMGGRGSRFANKGFDFPKPLIEIYGKPFFYWSTRSIEKFIELIDITFVVLQEHIDDYSIDKKIIEYFPDAKLIAIPDVLNGAVLTCMEGVQDINDDAPILFNDCDHMFRCRKFEQFISKGSNDIDGGLLTFWSDEDKFSYVRFDENHNVCQTVEKEVISNDAICGCYFFRNRKLFEKAVQTYLKECQYQEYFVSGVYNVMAKEKQIIKAFQTDFHVTYGVPEEYVEAETSDKYKELL